MCLSIWSRVRCQNHQQQQKKRREIYIYCVCVCVCAHCCKVRDTNFDLPSTFRLHSMDAIATSLVRRRIEEVRGEARFALSYVIHINE